LASLEAMMSLGRAMCEKGENLALHNSTG